MGEKCDFFQVGKFQTREFRRSSHEGLPEVLYHPHLCSPSTTGGQFSMVVWFSAVSKTATRGLPVLIQFKAIASARTLNKVRSIPERFKRGYLTERSLINSSTTKKRGNCPLRIGFYLRQIVIIIIEFNMKINRFGAVPFPIEKSDIGPRAARSQRRRRRAEEGMR